jgi:hypothetical protein
MKTDKEFAQHLEDIGACADARIWAKGKTAQEAWDQCERADWLLWWVAQEKPDSKQDLVRAACRIARLVLHLVPQSEDRPRLAIEAAEKWADEPTPENLERVEAARAAAEAAEAAAAWEAEAAAAARAAEARAAEAARAAAWEAAAAAAARAAAAAAAAAAEAAEAAEAAAARAAEARAAEAARAADINSKALAIVRETFGCPWGARE